jgi:hypothetical protein
MLLVMTLIIKIRIVLSKAEFEIVSIMKNQLRKGVMPKKTASVFFLCSLVTSEPTTKIVEIYVSPIAKFITPKLYPISFMEYSMT